MPVTMLLLLRDLEPQFLRCDVGVADECHGRALENGEIQWGGFEVDILTHVHTLTEADGIRFLCPKCFVLNKGPLGTHNLQVFFAGKNVPEHIGVGPDGRPHRWEVRGNDYLDLTLAPSIRLKSGCKWHGFIEHGALRSV